MMPERHIGKKKCSPTLKNGPNGLKILQHAQKKALSEISFVFPKILIFMEFFFRSVMTCLNNYARVPAQNFEIPIFLQIWLKQLKKIKVSEIQVIS